MYTPSPAILEKYASALVRFALNGGKGIKAGQTVLLIGTEATKPLFMECRRAILKAGGHVILQYLPDNASRSGADRDFYMLAKEHQISYFPTQYMQGLIAEIDHMLYLHAETDMHALHGVNPKKILGHEFAYKEWFHMRDKKEHQGKFTWTLALYGTPEMAKEAGMSEGEYWQQIINACFLDEKDPISHWKKVFRDLMVVEKTLNRLTPKIERLHITGPDIDLWMPLGEKRAWLGGRGRNIPSFEVFTSPDWRSVEGRIRFNQPLYRYGHLIDGIELHFAKGVVVKATASKNQDLLREMIRTKNADKVGEFSLTDRRHSRITRFMAETLYDENMGGPYGNTHIALGKAFRDCYAGDPSKVNEKEWEKLGYNDSSVHTDIISTAPRTVTAHLKDGSQKVIYDNGQFTFLK